MSRTVVKGEAKVEPEGVSRTVVKGEEKVEPEGMSRTVVKGERKVELIKYFRTSSSKLNKKKFSKKWGLIPGYPDHFRTAITNKP